MSDRDRLLELLRKRGSAGVSTFEVRRLGISGNPSQRKAELEELGYIIAVEPCTEGRRHGRRYTLTSEPAEVAASPSGRTPAPSPETSSAGRDLSGALFDSDEFRPPRRHDELAA